MRIVKLYEEFKQNINKSKIDYIFDIVLDGLKNNISMKKTLFNLKNDNIVSNDFTEYFFRNLTDEQKKIINKYNIQMSKDYISSLNGEDVGPEYTGKILSDVDNYHSKLTNLGYDTGFSDTYNRKYRIKNY